MKTQIEYDKMKGKDFKIFGDNYYTWRYRNIKVSVWKYSNYRVQKVRLYLSKTDWSLDDLSECYLGSSPFIEIAGKDVTANTVIEFDKRYWSADYGKYAINLTDEFYKLPYKKVSELIDHFDIRYVKDICDFSNPDIFIVDPPDYIFSSFVKGRINIKKGILEGIIKDRCTCMADLAVLEDEIVKKYKSVIMKAKLAGMVDFSVYVYDYDINGGMRHVQGTYREIVNQLKDMNLYDEEKPYNF